MKSQSKWEDGLKNKCQIFVTKGDISKQASKSTPDLVGVIEYSEAVKFIHTLLKQQSEWISVKDKMPKRGERVIWYHPKESGRNMLAEYFRVDCGDLPSRPATHWIPLPNVPE